MMEKKVTSKPIDFELIELLGEGLNSYVYKAIRSNDEFNIQNIVAVKILKSENFLNIWKNEIARLAAVRSNNCVNYYGWEIILEKPAIILEYVDGCTLAELLEVGGLEASEIYVLFKQAKEGIRDLCDQGLFHGDLNLHNIMINTQGIVKLVDFGIVDEKNNFFVTPQFVDPKVLMGEPPSFETDLFSLRAIAKIVEDKARSGSRTEDIEDIVGAQAKLAQKVQIASLSKRYKSGKTRSLHELKKTSPLRHAYRLSIILILMLLPLFSRGDVSVQSFLDNAFISIRSKVWLLVTVNNLYERYAPSDLTVKASQAVELKWQTAHNSGRTTLTPRAGEHIIFTDKGFTVTDGK